MNVMNIRDILNKLVWDPHYSPRKKQFFIQYTHRGVFNNTIRISCNQILRIHSDSFEYRNTIADEEVRIPYHRIEKIFNYLTHCGKLHAS